jgi:hypothetical protein
VGKPSKFGYSLERDFPPTILLSPTVFMTMNFMPTHIIAIIPVLKIKIRKFKRNSVFLLNFQIFISLSFV